MKNLFLYIILCLLSFQMQAQHGAVARAIVENQEDGLEFRSMELFQENIQSATADHRAKEVLTQGTLLDLNPSDFKLARKSGAEAISLRIPTIENPDLEVLLVKVNIHTDDFKATDQFGNEIKDADLGVHYRGMIKGNPESIVAISILENEIMGFASSNEGNLVIGRLGRINKTNQHIAYYDKNLTIQSDFECKMEDDGVGYLPEQLKPIDVNSNKLNTNKCVRIYTEINEDIRTDKGAGTFAYISGIFNQSAAIYANEAVTIVSSGMLAWVSGSPYTGTTTGTLLDQFQDTRNSFNGDLAHLVGYAGGGGLAAGFSGFCNADLDESMCYSDIGSSYNDVPTYSWTIMVYTHEMGHLMGLRHTHACVWNGNNTAIDGCAGYTEGSCSIPGNPTNGGTIMSYCHLQAVGINFNEGFGPQPGTLLRNNATSASCLTSCSCLDDLVLFGNTNSGDNLDYEAANTITSTQEISASTDVDYQAGSSVTLEAGFTIATGSTLDITIGGCTNAKMAKGYVTTPLEETAVSNHATRKIPTENVLTSFPNPFSNTTTIAYFLEEDTEVTLQVFNTLGERVALLVNENQTSGNHEINFSARDLTPGFYYAALSANGVNQTLKLVINK